MPALGCKGAAAFYYEAFGRQDRRNDQGEFIENWFIACRRGNPLIAAWHQAFLRFWKGRTNSFDGGGLAESPMFRGVDLSCMKDDQKNYLTMHSCFKWLLDRDKAARQLWQDDLLLLRADDGALGWILDLDDVDDPVLSWTTSTLVG